MIRVVVVDDSSFMRRSLTALIEKTGEIQVVATANNGKEGIEKIKEFDPDVVTLDVEMPVMDGLTALKHIMSETPLPVIMISSLTQDGADTTLSALDIGAVDYVGKLTSGSLPVINSFGEDLVAKIKAVARRKAFLRLLFKNRQNAKKATEQRAVSTPPSSPGTPRTASSSATRQAFESSRAAAASASAQNASQAARGLSDGLKAKVTLHARRFSVVVIGVSTGGPPAVQNVLSKLPADFPVPIVIAQHMPGTFTGPFAKRLDSICPMSVKECDPVEKMRPGTVYICPGGRHIRVENKLGALLGVVTEEPLDAIYKPSASVLMETAGVALGRSALGVMLTGMGSDGLEGAKILKEKGGTLLAQSEATCVVYGMPKAVVDAKLADEIIDIDDMGAAIMQYFS